MFQAAMFNFQMEQKSNYCIKSIHCSDWTIWSKSKKTELENLIDFKARWAKKDIWNFGKYKLTSHYLVYLVFLGKEVIAITSHNVNMLIESINFYWPEKKIRPLNYYVHANTKCSYNFKNTFCNSYVVLIVPCLKCSKIMTSTKWWVAIGFVLKQAYICQWCFPFAIRIQNFLWIFQLESI